jgi:hypothetical protein
LVDGLLAGPDIAIEVWVLVRSGGLEIIRRLEK